MDLVIEPVPPGDGDGAGPAADLGRRRRGAARPARGRGLSRRSARVSAAARVAELEAATSPACRSCAAHRSALRAGEILAMLGPNGAGKSTLVKAVGRARAEVRRPGARCTAATSPRVPAHRHGARGAGLRAADRERLRQSHGRGESRARGRDLLEVPTRASGCAQAVRDCFPTSRASARLPAGRLSGGQRQMLAVARALIGGPQVLMLDEPSAGLSPQARRQVFRQAARGPRRRRDDRAGRAEREGGARASPTAPRCWSRAASASSRAAPRPARSDPRIAELYLGARARRCAEAR